MFPGGNVIMMQPQMFNNVLRWINYAINFCSEYSWDFCDRRLIILQLGDWDELFNANTEDKWASCLYLDLVYPKCSIVAATVNKESCLISNSCQCTFLIQTGPIKNIKVGLHSQV